jgi:hypothetical protein
VILATKEAEIRRTKVPGQFRQKILVTHFNRSTPGRHLSHSSFWRKQSYLKNNQSRRAGDVAEVGEHLFSKREAMSSSPTTAKATTHTNLSFLF